jgi:hypothetical protein
LVVDTIKNHSFAVKLEILLIILIREKANQALGAGLEKSAKLCWVLFQNTIFIESLIDINDSVLVMVIWVKIWIMGLKLNFSHETIDVLPNISEIFFWCYINSVIQAD